MPCEVLLVLVDIEEDVDDVRVIGHLCHFGEILTVLLKEGGMLDEQREEVVFNDGVAHLLALHPDICNEVCFRPFFLLTIDPQAVSQFFVEGADVSDVRLVPRGRLQNDREAEEHRLPQQAGCLPQEGEVLRSAKTHQGT